LSSNVTAVGGALSLTLIDAEIKAIVDAGGNPNVIVMNTTQKQKLDALDANIVRMGKETRIGGNPDVQTWQSGIMTTPLQVIVDFSVRQDQVWILDTTKIMIGTMSGNGVNGAFSITDATTPGKDGSKKVIRGKYGIKIMHEASHAVLKTLTT
jgi:hypothetical protein